MKCSTLQKQLPVLVWRYWDQRGGPWASLVPLLGSTEAVQNLEDWQGYQAEEGMTITCLLQLGSNLNLPLGLPDKVNTSGGQGWLATPVPVVGK